VIVFLQSNHFILRFTLRQQLHKMLDSCVVRHGLAFETQALNVKLHGLAHFTFDFISGRAGSDAAGISGE